MPVSKEYKVHVLNPNTEIHYAVSYNISHVKFPHEHDFYELMLVLSGEIELTAKNKKLLLPDGSLILIKPNEAHSKIFTQGSSQANLAFSENTFNELFNYLGDGFNKVFFTDNDSIPMVHLSQSQKNQLIKEFDKLHLLPNHDYKLIKTRLKILLFNIFTKYFKAPDVNILTQNDMPIWLSELIRKMYKKENFTQGLSALMNFSNKSQEHVNRNMKKYLNLSPTQFINNLRLNYAANLLTNTDMVIIDVCFEAGFNNLSYFYSVFKKKYGYSPHKYRLKTKTKKIT